MRAIVLQQIATRFNSLLQLDSTKKRFATSMRGELLRLFEQL